jgi:hypothetical protein
LIKLIKSSSAELSDLSELKDPDLESSICVARKVVAKLYDPKAKYKSCHTNLNKLRVRLAASKDCSLVRFNQLKNRIFSNTKDSRRDITTSQSMNRWENFRSYARQRTTQVMNWNRNKQELISFIGEFISKFVNADNPLPVGQTLYLAGTFRNPEVVKKIAGDQVTDCVDLISEVMLDRELHKS